MALTLLLSECDVVGSVVETDWEATRVTVGVRSSEPDTEPAETDLETDADAEASSLAEAEPNVEVKDGVSEAEAGITEADAETRTELVAEMYRLMEA